MRNPWLWAGVLFGTVALLAVGFWMLRPGSQPLVVDYYRVVDEDSIIIGTLTGLNVETRITKVAEASDSVTITVQSFTIALGPSTDRGYPIELPVELGEPLGERAVFDPYHAVPLKD
jgi:hypothetical protein